MMNKVKGFRVMVNMTQEEMAKVLGISVRSYVNKENGSFDVSELVKIRDTLNDRNLTISGRSIILDDLV